MVRDIERRARRDPLILPCILAALLLGSLPQARAQEAKEPTDAPTITGTGTLMPHKSSNLGPLVEGRVERIHVNVGDRVEAGSPLFEMRPETYQLKVEEMKAAVAMADAKLKQAQQNMGRTDRLSDRGIASVATKDNVTGALHVATGEVELAKARLRQAEQEFADTVVRAPFRGAVTVRYVDEGVFLTNRVPGGTGSSVVQVQKIDILVAVVRVPSRDLPRLSVGSHATLRIDGVDKPVTAKVDIINDMVDPATRTVEIRLGIDNVKYLIRPGVFVQAEIRPIQKATELSPQARPAEQPDRRSGITLR